MKSVLAFKTAHLSHTIAMAPAIQNLADTSTADAIKASEHAHGVNNDARRRRLALRASLSRVTRTHSVRVVVEWVMQ